MSDVISAPAPWQLHGRAYISLWRLPAEQLDEACFVPASLQGKRQTGLSIMMFVDYADSPVGPYHELLFIPGMYRFADKRNRFTISRIFVSTQDSVVNGQRNWGIPKELAQFDVQSGEDGRDRIQIRTADQRIAELNFRHYGPGLPVPGALLPAAWRTLAQHWEDRTFIYRPAASGTGTLAKLESASFNPQQFPDLSQGRLLACFHLRRFRMTFPVSQMLERV